ncbi:MAG: hypothetical protein LBG17_09260 [Bacteroidales bacterium]|jgi:hypothetical protein|nr:hypothetical protein [Bacteroidales bacterium]
MKNIFITFSCSWLAKKITAKCDDSGNFILRVKTLNATPVKQHTFSIADNTGAVGYSDVVFGEVWLAGGQSNMAFELKKSKDVGKYIEESNNENIRFYYAPHIYYEGYKVKEKGRWVKSSVGTDLNVPNNNRIILSFSIFDSEGPALSKDCGELGGFEAMLDDGSTVVMKAVLLDKNKIELYCDDAYQVKQVRYGWANYFEPCLVNTEGLYASPFRVNIE